jgi:hypothetical protein
MDNEENDEEVRFIGKRLITIENVNVSQDDDNNEII